METNEKIIIYQTKDGETSIDVRLEGETVWLSQSQLSELFNTDRTSILRHIKNIYKTEELDESSTCAFFAQVREEGSRIVTRQIPYYNLDMIISVGYRVNSKRGTQFRIWANKVLKDFLIKGYAINDKITKKKYEELSQLVHILGRTINSHELSNKENLDLVNVVTDYTYALDTLDRYDYHLSSFSRRDAEKRRVLFCYLRVLCAFARDFCS